MAVTSHLVARLGFHPAFCWYESYTRTAKYDVVERRYESIDGPESFQWRPGIIAERRKRGTATKDFGSTPITKIRPDTAVPRHGKSVKQSPGLVDDHWIYIFVSTRGAKKAKWFAEMYKPAKEEVAHNPNTTRETRLAWPHTTSDVGKSDAKPNVAHSINGVDKFITAIGVPYRLSDKCLEQLEQESVLLADWIHVSSRLEQHHAGAEQVTGLRWLELPVLYPWIVARRLAHKIRLARSRHSRANGMPGENPRKYSGPPIQPNQEATESCKQYALASALAAMMKGSSKLARAIGARFGGDGAHDLKTCLKTRPYHQLRYHVEAELLGTELSGWLSRRLVRIVMDGYISATSGALEELMLSLMLAATALKHTSTGLVFLRALRHADWSGTLLGSIAAPSSPDAKERIEEIKDYTTPLLAMSTVVMTARILSDGIESAHVVNELEHLFGASFGGNWSKSFDERKKIITRHILSEALFTNPGRKIDPVTMRARRFAMTDGGTRRLEAVIGGVDTALKVLDAVNLALAVRELHEISNANSKQRQKQMRETVLLSLELVQPMLEFACKDEKGLLRLAPRALGTIVAVWTAGESAVKSHAALTRGDLDAFAAMAVTTTTAVLTVGLAAIGKAGAAAGHFGAILAAVGTLGALIYVWVKDTEFETFVAHTAFGERALEASDTAAPAWANVPLNELASSWDAQFEALASIQGQFSLYTDHTMHHDSSDINDVRLRPGTVGQGSVFIASWHWKERGDPPLAPRRILVERVEGCEGMMRDAEGIYVDFIIPSQIYRRSSGKPLPVGLQLAVTREVYAAEGVKVEIPLEGPVVIDCIRTGRSQSEKVRSMDKP